jgi:hypothetical protein
MLGDWDVPEESIRGLIYGDCRKKEGEYMFYVYVYTHTHSDTSANEDNSLAET